MTSALTIVQLALFTNYCCPSVPPYQQPPTISDSSTLLLLLEIVLRIILILVFQLVFVVIVVLVQHTFVSLQALLCFLRKQLDLFLIHFPNDYFFPTYFHVFNEIVQQRSTDNIVKLTTEDKESPFRRGTHFLR